MRDVTAVVVVVVTIIIINVIFVRSLGRIQQMAAETRQDTGHNFLAAHEPHKRI